MSFDEIKNKTIEENDLYEGLEIKEIERKAKEFYRSKEYSKALIGYNKLISLDDGNYKFYNRRGNAKYALKKYEEAIEDYKKALNINKDYRVFHSLCLACKKFSGIKDEVNITEEEFDSSFIIYIY